MLLKLAPFWYRKPTRVNVNTFTLRPRQKWIQILLNFTPEGSITNISSLVQVTSHYLNRQQAIIWTNGEKYFESERYFMQLQQQFVIFGSVPYVGMIFITKASICHSHHTQVTHNQVLSWLKQGNRNIYGLLQAGNYKNIKCVITHLSMMFLYLSLLWEYSIELFAKELPCIRFTFSTRIIWKGIFWFMTGCLCSVVCCGLTTCPFYDGPLFAKDLMNWSD